MLYKNLNPTLNSDILNNAGFAFDGYYYVNPDLPIRFNKVDNGYAVSFIDPAAPQISESIANYCDLISLMSQVIPMVIELKSKDKTFTTGSEQLKYIADIIKNIFKFDKNINLAVINGPTGLQMRPNNEYTFTIVNGDIRQVKVYYDISRSQSDEPKVESGELTIEIAIQCISWPFLMSLLSNEVENFNKESDKLVINRVVLLNEDQEIPYFGMGIPTIHKK